MVKTRLAKDLGKIPVSIFYKRTLEYILRNLSDINSDLALYCFPDPHHPFFEYCRSKYNVILYTQEGNDLGDRMYKAIKNQLANYDSVVLIGSDCPEIDSTYINDAIYGLSSGADVVLGPAFDGGYALIASHQINKSIFDNIKWSTKDVLQNTKDNISALGWSSKCLSKVHDIDCLSDYVYFSKQDKYKHLFV